MYRIGHGFDVHPFREKRKLILCGIEINHKLGLDGHSDADVAVHALMDAILGALGLGDIGNHFPDTDPKYKNIDSCKLLEQVVGIMSQQNYGIMNADITIHAEEPKISPHISNMKDKLAKILNIDSSALNIKATTWEKLGFVGKKKGIAADAVVLLHGETITDKQKDTKKSVNLLFDDDEPIKRRVKKKGGVVIYSDGASRGNPGPAAAGVVIEDADGKKLNEISMFLGKLTNNQAEYQALILALSEVTSMRPEHVLIKMDSELVVKQLKGEYKVKDEKMQQLYLIAKQQLSLLNSWTVEHIPRSENKKADALANKALDSQG